MVNLNTKQHDRAQSDTHSQTHTDTYYSRLTRTHGYTHTACLLPFLFFRLPQLMDYLTLKFKHFFRFLASVDLPQYLTLCPGSNVVTAFFPVLLLNRCSISLPLCLFFSARIRSLARSPHCTTRCVFFSLFAISSSLLFQSFQKGSTDDAAKICCLRSAFRLPHTKSLFSLDFPPLGTSHWGERGVAP